MSNMEKKENVLFHRATYIPLMSMKILTEGGERMRGRGEHEREGREREEKINK